MHDIEDLEMMRKAIGEESPMARKKIYNHLNVRMQKFIEQSPLLMLSSVDELGFPTISPKGDKPGFVDVIDNKKLLIPERKGNKLAFSLTNILSNNKVSLIFIVPGSNETLRVAGECRLLGGELLCKKLASDSHDALLVMEVSIINAYFHCNKAFLRSQIWSASSWPEPIKISFGKEIAENTGADDSFIKQVDTAVEDRALTDL
ncbi:hypothetical protein E2R68_06575 [Psychromonas sp. RZ22]|uniref:MSMEG_1061 family FMN-dependent PPOX-type flavoprotein n=1 Tax=Psychromonas algarum TaxID=2555643 RepID=UPI001068107D|nr:MSMEG_1061 family FMN-dependent PPOX-type flavoprotein [Psychromonas sp. RZ22]TEW54834.1 hypothetical protein E2R68_06575 [Psychromonas sp. RZ22]